MGENGDWFNEHGKFEHPKIIRHFHSSIRQDKGGYYLYQETDEHEEKVYFPYKDTAIFIFDIKKYKDIHISLILNTNKTIKLNPERLFQKDDKLFLKTPDDLIQFTDRALLKISKFIEENNGSLVFKLNNHFYPIEDQ